MVWVNFFHLYQPPEWNEEIVRRVTTEAYWPLARILENRPGLKITLNISGALTEQLLALGYDDLLATYRRLLERGQIEFVGSAMYHPILPLIPIDEVRRQIELQDQLHRRVFGSAYRPVGFFPPEMAFDSKLEPLLLELGYHWVIVDEVSNNRDVGAVAFDRRYVSKGGLGIVMRNRHVSDFLSFGARVDDPSGVASAILSDVRSRAWLVTAMDGENLGHHRHGVDKLWEGLVTQTGVETLTISGYLRSLKLTQSINPVPSSWSSQVGELRSGISYGLWHHGTNPIHHLQWELAHVVIQAVHVAAADPNFDAARRLLDRALTSDKFWWASASPWWDFPIVVRETQRLADVIEPLTTAPPVTKHKVAKLMDQITKTAQLWDTTGLARTRQSSYLEDTGDVRFMGGQPVRV